MAYGVVSDQNPRHAAILARPTARTVGVWLIAQRPVKAVYPCRCRLGSRCTTGVTETDSSRWCPCYGRVDVTATPTHCCTRRKGYPYGLEAV